MSLAYASGYLSWLDVLMSVLVNLLILVSQTCNVLLGGDPDEMLSSRSYRLRHDWRWDWMRRAINASPLGFWRRPGMGHCESCYHAEKERLKERLSEYSE